MRSSAVTIRAVRATVVTLRLAQIEAKDRRARLQNVGSMLYEDVLRALSGAGVKFAVAGGVAVNLHGIPRMTQDLDLLIDMSRENVLALVECLTGLGYRPRA